jgi:hypothetical protein
MPSEKFFVHKEDGSLVRLKGRLVRFLDEEPPTGSDKSAIRTALEVSPDAEGLVQADVGTDPQNLVLHQHLGDLAYQSAEGISAGTVSAETLEVESTTGTGSTQALTVTDGTDTNFVVQEDGSVGIGNSSPSSYHSSANDLVVGDTVGHRGITIISGSGNSGNIYFADGTSGNELYRGYVGYNQGSNLLSFGTAATTQWQINSSGNLVAYAAGVGIDFGAVATSAGDGTGTTGTPADSVLADYEVGSWTPSYSSSGATFSYTHQSGRYVKVGKQVTAQFYLVATASGTTTNAIDVTGLPFLCVNSTLAEFAAALWFTGTNPIAFITSPNTPDLLGCKQNTGSPLRRRASDVSGEYLVGTVTYEATS